MDGWRELCGFHSINLEDKSMHTAETKRRDVVVVGAGPVGLSLALGLARRGRDVLVLEKKPTTAEHSRAPAIWPATQEIMTGLGVIDAFLDEGIIIRRLELWDVDRDCVLLSVPLEELADETPYPQLLIVPQSRTERLLLEALQREPTAEIRFSCQVTDLVQDPSHVEVRYRQSNVESSVKARFVAGCDGAHSTVRERLGASFEGTTYPIRAALADVEIDAGPGLRFPRISSRPRIAIGIRMKARLWRLILPFAETDRLPLERRIEEAVASLFHTDYRLVWQSEFRLHRRVSSRFVDGRVVLAGDAAHLNSPVGGQGMNAGIKDTTLLTEAMIEALDRDANNPLLEFGRQRRKEIQVGVNRFTDLLTRVLLMGRGRMLRPVLRLANGAMRVPVVRRRFLRRLAMLE